MPTPSLLIVPARFKTGKLYSQIPTSGAGDFTVTRNTAARRFDSAGLVASVASGIPRLDYYTSGGVTGCPALLVEPAATNVLSYSEEFDNAAWGKSAMTVSTGTTALFTAPDGTTNADKIIATSGNVAHNINRSGIASAAYTFSVFAKAGEESVISLWLRGASVRAEFNLVSGTVSNITTTSARIENYGNGWYRCTVYDSTAGTTAHVYGRGGAAYAGNGSDGFYLWGAQLETGSVATSYIPTTTGTGSRSADVVSVSGAVSGSIGQTEGTIYVEGVITNYADAAASFITISDNTINNRLEIRKGSPGSIIFERESATQSASTSINATGQVNGIFKMAVAYKSGDTAFFINGVQVATTNAATFTMNTLTHIYLGNNASGSARRLNDRIRAFAIYPNRIPNTAAPGVLSLQSLTT